MELLKFLKEFLSFHKIFKSLKDQSQYSIWKLYSWLGFAKTFMLLHCWDKNPQSLEFNYVGWRSKQK